MCVCVYECEKDGLNMDVLYIYICVCVCMSALNNSVLARNR